MKRLAVVILVLAGLALAGCSSEFYQHDTLYKNWDHLKFSWWEYKSPSADHAKKSNDQSWWGREIPYIPAQ